MNRNLSLFLAFLAAVLLALGAVLLWFGPLTELVLDGDRRSAPVYVLELGARPLGEDDSDAAALTALISEEGGETLILGQLYTLITGRFARDEWQSSRLYRLPTGGDFVRMYTSQAYSDLQTDEGTGHRLLLAGSVAPEARTPRTLVTFLFRSRGDRGGDATGSLMTSVARFDGRLFWHAETLPIEGNNAWDSVLMIGFPNRDRALAWSTDLASKTDMALLHTHYAEVAGLLLESA